MVNKTDKIPTYLLDRMIENVYISDDMTHLELPFLNMISRVKIETKNINYTFTIDGKEHRFDKCSHLTTNDIKLGETLIFEVPIPDKFDLSKQHEFKIMTGIYNGENSYILTIDFKRQPV